MNGTEQFTRTISEYLNLRAATDPLFAPKLRKPYKNIENCVTYILKQVQQSACNGFEDDEIYSMAVHYYDEDDLEVGSRVACHVVVKRESRSPQAGDTAVSGPRATQVARAEASESQGKHRLRASTRTFFI